MPKVLSKIDWGVDISKAEILKLQPRQQEFVDCEADIALTGGGAGGGKTVSIVALVSLLKFIKNPRHCAIIFRRLCPQITKPGGLLDESRRWYKALGAKLNLSRLEWLFKSGAKVVFSHLQHKEDIYQYQGQNINLIIFDELTHFLEEQFWYLFSRVRSTSGLKTLMRATCNADADSWVAPLIGWWIDKDGYFIPERSGVIRYLTRIEDTIQWGDTREELEERYPGEIPISFTFFGSKLEDNQALMETDPSYKGKLQAQSSVERARLLEGNWKIRRSETQLFNSELIPLRAIGRWTPPQFGHNYLIGVDPNFGSQGGDFFVCQCWDLTESPYTLVQEYRENRSSVTNSIQKVLEMIEDYNPVLVSVEKNGGGQTILERIIEKRPDILVKPVVTSRDSKIIHTDRIALALEAGLVKFPSDWEGTSEMYNFSKMSREAAKGNDDCIMAWAVAFAHLDEAVELSTISPTLLS